MSSYMVRHIPAGVINAAKARAREHGTTLDAALLAFLESYAEGTDRASAGRKGGMARSEALSPEERSAIARKGAEARWGGTERGE
jgi:plasmid stability protein